MGCVPSIKKVSPNTNENGANRMPNGTTNNYETNYSNDKNQPYFLSRQYSNAFDQKNQDEDAFDSRFINGQLDNYLDDGTDENVSR